MKTILVIDSLEENQEPIIENDPNRPNITIRNGQVIKEPCTQGYKGDKHTMYVPMSEISIDSLRALSVAAEMAQADNNYMAYIFVNKRTQEIGFVSG